MTDLITKYYELKENGGAKTMNESIKTLAFQVPEELKERIDRHLADESKRTGKKVTPKDFMLSLIEKALAEAETE